MAKDPTPTRTHHQDGIDELAAHFNLDPKIFRQAIETGVARGQIAVQGLDTATEPALRGLGHVARILQGQAAVIHPEGPPAFAQVARGMVRRGELRPIAWKNAEARPKIEGLPEAVMTWALLKEEQAQRLTLAPARADQLKYLASVVAIKRAYLEIATDLAHSFEADLAVDENQAKELLQNDVDPIRDAIERDPELGGPAEVVLSYLYGAAQKGADTRATLADQRRKMAEKVGTAARVEGIDQGMRLMQERVQAALKAGPRSDDDPPADGASRDRRG